MPGRTSTAYCPACRQVKTGRWHSSGVCHSCRRNEIRHSRGRPRRITTIYRIDNVPPWEQPLPGDDMTEEQVEALVARQLQCAPLVFWREVVLRDQPYDVPEWALRRLKGGRSRQIAGKAGE